MTRSKEDKFILVQRQISEILDKPLTRRQMKAPLIQISRLDSWQSWANFKFQDSFQDSWCNKTKEDKTKRRLKIEDKRRQDSFSTSSKKGSKTDSRQVSFQDDWQV